MLQGWKVLILNSDGIPLQVSAWEEVIHLPLEGLAFVHEWARDASGEHVPLHAGGGRVVIELPSVMQVKTYVKRSPRMSFNRHAVYARDELVCQYCGDQLALGEATIDHVIPRHVLGGEASTWGNCVTCCKDCNGRKGGRSLEQMRKANLRTHNGRVFRLLREPTRPSIFGVGNFLRHVSRKNLEWLLYLPGWRSHCRVQGKEWLEEAYDAAFPEGLPWS